MKGDVVDFCRFKRFKEYEIDYEKSLTENIFEKEKRRNKEFAELQSEFFDAVFAIFEEQYPDAQIDLEERMDLEIRVARYTDKIGCDEVQSAMFLAIELSPEDPEEAVLYFLRICIKNVRESLHGN